MLHAHHMCAGAAEAGGSLELELQVIVSHQMWVLGTEPRLCASAAN